MDDLRAAYCNWFEKTFWAPDDWGAMTTEPGATWFSGQARRHENTEKLKLQIDAAHRHGIKAITYGKCMAGGNPGWELARRRPEWFTVNVHGRTMGRPADVCVIDRERIALDPVEVAHDLPGGAPRLVQTATGYRRVLVAGGRASPAAGATGSGSAVASPAESTSGSPDSPGSAPAADCSGAGSCVAVSPCDGWAVSAPGGADELDPLRLSIHQPPATSTTAATAAASQTSPPR